MIGQRSWSDVTRIGSALVTAALVLTVAAAVVGVVLLAIGPRGEETKTYVTVNVPASAVDALPPNIALDDPVRVQIDIGDPTGKQSIGLVLAGLPVFALIVVVLVLLRGIMLSVRRGDPFVSGNVRRLRWIALSLIVGGPILQIFPQLFLQGVAEDAGLHSSWTSFSFPGTLPLVGLGVLVLAQVFAHGVQLREDVEGTV